MIRCTVISALAATLLGVACTKERQVITIPLIDELPRAKISAKQPSFVSESVLNVGGDTRKCIFMHPVSTARFDLVVPAKAKLSFAVGMPQDVWNKPGDGVTFHVSIADGTSDPTVAFSRYVNPKAVNEDRVWLEAEVDLSLYEGQRVSLLLATDSGPSDHPGWDFAGWADPVIRGMTW
ncbi:hypothetical protein JXA88_02120 [Candidatus Fermentibacteria bacterium]|nr:hypothetical protein [Candidatus Fermentibacteria bacterium]